MNVVVVRLLIFLLAIGKIHADVRVEKLFPADRATEICVDTPLQLTFDRAPVLGKRGSVKIFRASDHVMVDSIDLATLNANMTEARKIAGTSYQMFPILIDGKTAHIFPHAGVLKWGTRYEVSIDASVFAEFSGVTWSFDTKKQVADAMAKRYRVEADGSGDFCTVQGVIDLIPAANQVPRRIEIGQGTYHELLRIDRKPLLTFLGKGAEKTVITYANNDRLNTGTNKRIVCHVGADDVSFEQLSLVNSTAKGGSQAEALRVNGRRVALRHCHLHSYQDTLLINSSRDTAYFKECLISGNTDFIWGSGRAVFDRCEIRSLASGYICQMRNPEGQVGAIFWDCRFTCEPGVTGVVFARIDAVAYPHSHVALIDCIMDSHITDSAWLNTAKQSPESLELSFYEYRSKTPYGKLVDVSKRATFSRQLRDDEAKSLRDFSHIWGDGKPE